MTVLAEMTPNWLRWYNSYLPRMTKLRSALEDMEEKQPELLAVLGTSKRATLYAWILLEEGVWEQLDESSTTATGSRSTDSTAPESEAPEPEHPPGAGDNMPTDLM